MIIQSVIQTYVFNQTSGAVTEPVNGNWLQAYCEFLGVTQPVNASWLQALCIAFWYYSNHYTVHGQLP